MDRQLAVAIGEISDIAYKTITDQSIDRSISQHTSPATNNQLNAKMANHTLHKNKLCGLFKQI